VLCHFLVLHESLLAIESTFNHGDGRYFRAQPLGKRKPAATALPASYFPAQNSSA
jgi:hypothetical protein